MTHIFRSQKFLFFAVCTAFLSTLSCASDPLTEVVFVVDADAIRAFDAVEIVVRGPNGQVQMSSASTAGGTFPRYVSLVNETGELGPFRAEISALSEGVVLVERSATFFFTAEQTRQARVVIHAACNQVSCDSQGQTCIRGMCADDRIETTTWQGRPSF